MFRRAVRYAPWRVQEDSGNSRSGMNRTNTEIGGNLSKEEILVIIRAILAEAGREQDYPSAEEMFGHFVCKLNLVDPLHPFGGAVIRVTGCPFSGKSSLVCGIANVLSLGCAPR